MKLVSKTFTPETEHVERHLEGWLHGPPAGVIMELVACQMVQQWKPMNSANKEWTVEIRLILGEAIEI